MMAPGQVVKELLSFRPALWQVILLVTFMTPRAGHAQCANNVGCFPATEDLLLGYPAMYPARTIQVTSTCGSPGPGEQGQLVFNRLVPNDTTAFTCMSSEHAPATMTDKTTYTVSIPGLPDVVFTVGVIVTYWQSNNTIATIGGTAAEQYVTLNFTHPFLIREVTGIFVAPQVSDTGPNGTDARPLAYSVERFGADGQWRPWRMFSKNCNEFPGFSVQEDGGPSFNATTPFCQKTQFGGAENEEPVSFNRTYYNAYQFSFSPAQDYNPEYTNNLVVSEYYVTTAVRLRLVSPVGVTPLTSYYAIADVTVVGSCYCNGHASTCTGTNKEQCQCQHNTQGATCDSCLPLFNNKPWRHGTLSSGNPCEVCSCNGLATSCHYDGVKGYGVCDNCSQDSTGDHCDDCLPGYTVNPALKPNATVALANGTCNGFNGTQNISYECNRYCIPCSCNRNGTVQNSSYTCNSTTGTCQCKDNVQGDKCDACKPSTFNLNIDDPLGCSACSCDVRGSLNVTDVCSAVDGSCRCKNNTRGRNCDSCKPETFDLRADNPDGCTACGCDPGAALNNACAVEGGQCACRANLEGRDCRQPKSGYFVPKIDHFRFEAEFQPENVNLTREDRVGEGLPQGTVTGRGLLRMSPGNQATFTFSVPITANYDVVLRYESQGQATLSGEVSMINGAAYSCAGTDITADQKWSVSATAQPATSRGFADLTTVCMKGGGDSSTQQYRLTLTLDGAAVNDLLVDSVVLLPKIGGLVVVTNATAEQRLLLENCRSAAKGANLPSRENCTSAEFSIMAEFFNGAPPCEACNATGTVAGSVCNPIGGRCVCKSGVTLPRCEMCTVDSYGLDLASGCIACNCNPTGSVRLSCNESGVCECRANVTGLKCDSCLPDHFGLASGQGCQPCTCNTTYAVNNTCEDSGQCLCKPGVGGLHCDVCRDGFYNLTSDGCTSCGCHVDGSAPGTCDKASGVCTCKANVQGDKCDTCKPGFYGVGPWHELGCLPCFCSGHSSNCSSASGWFSTMTRVTWDLTTAQAVQDRWTAVDDQGQPAEVQYPIQFYTGSTGSRTQYVMRMANTGAVQNLSNVYFLATESFLGYKRSAYGQFLYLNLLLSNQTDVTANSTQGDVILKGAYTDFTLVHSLQSIPGTQPTNYTIPLVEGSWRVTSTTGPLATYAQLLQTLSALQSFRVRAKFSNTTGAEVDLYSAAIAHSTTSNTSGVAVNNVEQCNCQDAFMGQFCEMCSLGNKRQSPGGGPFTACTGCTCNGHAGGPCDSESGVCNCTHNTQGDACQTCLPGFHGDATQGTPEDCTACMCPGNVVLGEVNVFADTCSTGAGGQPVCNNCSVGHIGDQCERCQEGYYGQPTNVSFYGGSCQSCQCNGRADTCNSTTGVCQSCRNNTAGKECDVCAPGFFGDAMTTGCTPCNCTLPGATGSCDPSTGQCECRPNVQGFLCDRCVALAFNYSSGQGCSMCDCHPSGAIGNECNYTTGQCTCRTHALGRRCDACEDTFWNLNVASGCDPCNCNASGTATIEGSTFGTCDITTGQCTCARPGIIGRTCNACSPISKTPFTFVRTFYSGTFPQCELCGECFDSWGTKIDALSSDLGTLDSRTRAVWSNYEFKTVEVSAPTISLMKQQLADAESSVQRASNITSTLSQLSSAFLEVEEASNNVTSSLEELRAQLNATQSALAELTSFDGSTNVSNTSTTAVVLRAILTELTNQITDAYTRGNSSWVRVRELSSLVGNTESSRQQLQDRVNRAQRLLEVAKQTFDSARRISNGTFREGFEDNQNSIDIVNRSVASAQDSLNQVKAILGEVTSQFQVANQTMTSVIQQSSNLRSRFSQLANQSSIARANTSNAEAAGAQAQTKVNRFKTLADSALANITSQLSQVVEAIERLVAAQTDLSDALQASQNTINVAMRPVSEMTTLANQIRDTLVSADAVTATNEKAASAQTIAQSTLNKTETAIDDSRRALQQVQGIQQNLADARTEREQAQSLLSQSSTLNATINQALTRLRGGNNESSIRVSDVTTTSQATTTAALALIDRISATTQCLRTRESQAAAASGTATAAKQDSTAASKALSDYLQTLGSLSQASAERSTSIPLAEINSAKSALDSMTSALTGVEQITDLTALLQEYADQRDELTVLEQEIGQLQSRLDGMLQTLQLITPTSGCDVN